MPQNILSQKNSVVIVGLLLALLGASYAGYTFWQGLASQTEAKVDTTLMSPEIAQLYASKGKINLKEKDIAFIKKPFYTELENNTVEIPTVEPVGRPNPFWAP